MAEESAVQPTKRSTPLDRDRFDSFFSDGRLIAQTALRKAVFQGGIDPAIRKDVWFFLLGYFPFYSTPTERDLIRRDRKMEYLALKERWMEELSGCTGTDSSAAFSALDELAPEEQFAFIQAKVGAMRYEIDHKLAEDSMRIISKDVPRTDRQLEYFAGDDNPHLLWLTNILTTFAVFHQEVGYAQGMNDVLAMILFVMDDEVDAYWCFSKYIETIQKGYTGEGMTQRAHTLARLLGSLEPDLYARFVELNLHDVGFCHKWLLLGFKREFTWEDAIRMFEILCSHHLDVSSSAADQERSKALREKRGKELASESITLNQAEPSAILSWKVEEEYTFELFVSVAILRTYKEKLMAAETDADVYQFINRLSEKMDLDVILTMAEEVFFEHCRKSV
eukprot:m.170929 g.170929  ORF g.170929 m.170929 type:complete len:393 (-) comp14541_c0_seq1:323-1501(-)